MYRDSHTYCMQRFKHEKPEKRKDGVQRFWTLDRCLPGQRNAQFFNCDHLHSIDFKNTPLLPSLFKHKTRNVAPCSHVDDLVLCGQREDFVWLVEELEKKFTVSGGEIIPSPEQDLFKPVRFLKRRHFFLS